MRKEKSSAGLTDAVRMELGILEVEPFLHHRLRLGPRRRLYVRRGGNKKRGKFR